MQRVTARNSSPIPQLTSMAGILVMSKLYKNPEKKGWDSKGKGECYPGKIRQEDLC